MALFLCDGFFILLHCFPPQLPRSNGYTFVALKPNNTATGNAAVVWGENTDGIDLVRSKLRSGVKTVYFTSGATAVLKEDGSVVTFGRSR